MSRDKIKIGEVKGDVIGGNVSGTGNIFGKKVEIHQQSIQKLHPEFAESLKDFSSSVESLMKKNSVPQIDKERIQQQIGELAEETQEIEPGAQVPYVKQSKLKAKIAEIADNLMKVLPSAAETAASFTPLAPFSKVIGESVEGIVKAVTRR